MDDEKSLDALDRNLLRQLQDDSRTSVALLSRRLGLARTRVVARIRNAALLHFRHQLGQSRWDCTYRRGALKTLAGKARTGRLDELKALELLREAVLL